MDILDHINEWALKAPNRLCYIHRDHQLTYGELKGESDTIAQWMIEKFGTDRSPIIVHGHMDPMMPVLFLACVKSGHAYIPVDESVPSERVSMIAQSSQSKLVFSSTPDSLPLLKAEIIDVHELEVKLQNSVYPHFDNRYAVQDEETFYIIYTSGSTGKPKGVQIPRRALTSFTTWMLDDFQLEEGLTFMNQAPYSFDLSVMDLYPALISGGTLWAIDQEMIARPKELFASLAQSGINVWTSTPSFAEMCLMEPSFSSRLLPNLRTLLFCGETLPVSVAKRLKERFPNADIINTYGPTETTVAVTSIKITQDMIDSGNPFPVGRCKPDCTIAILDQDGLPVPEGDKGEIVICGPSVGQGYLGELEKTKASFNTVHRMPAYHTRDVGSLIDGVLYYFGRMDHQIKLHGFRMELEEIEHVLTACHYVKQAIVIPIKSGDRYDHLVAVVVPDEHPFESTFKLSSALRQELARVLPSYMIPRKFTYRSSLPMTANGKVDRSVPLKEVIQ
ncbi:D-alanine--poly(phosphoribitol) ligase subunit DltA [Sporolactobacillus kofuensis]|uniref:D-alanine--D-alanyl carrier protein ligase n=1 Tax=Sporolactobacillus kofuensis TaxID=269672 RepID=A0ABW1WCE4_9BACL|nr:D-alanine--poly(phosphoribitol) ligase subunit DltA [Sporolactobacillus kofuensis]MCO7175436.1 D-alanine--poly(phosphoribitol) ligase subunit DltA [Sporolactobacillus kofuensis]